MSEPYIAEIRMFAGNFAIRGWAFCDGQLLTISQNQALFSVVLTTFGGDGRTTFGLPEMRGRVAVHPGSGPGLTPVTRGQKSGTNTTTLTAENLPAHTHYTKGASEDAVSGNPGAKFSATTADNNYHGTGDENMGATSSTGGGVAVNNMQPYIGIYHLLALSGVFPSRD